MSFLSQLRLNAIMVRSHNALYMIVKGLCWLRLRLYTTSQTCLYNAYKAGCMNLPNRYQLLPSLSNISIVKSHLYCLSNFTLSLLHQSSTDDSLNILQSAYTYRNYWFFCWEPSEWHFDYYKSFNQHLPNHCMQSFMLVTRITWFQSNGTLCTPLSGMGEVSMWKRSI